jgi:membrane protein
MNQPINTEQGGGNQHQGSKSLFGASCIFGQLQDALNTIWSVRPKPTRGFSSFVRARFAVGGSLHPLHDYLQANIPGGHYVGLTVFYVFDSGIITLLFAGAFLLPAGC